MKTAIISILVILATACAESSVVCTDPEAIQDGVYDGLTYTSMIGLEAPRVASVWDTHTVIVTGRTVEFGVNDDKCRMRFDVDEDGGVDEAPKVVGLCEVRNGFLEPSRIVGQFDRRSFFLTIIGESESGAATTVRTSGALMHD